MALTVQIVALISITTHFLFFTFNGKGVSALENFGDVLEIFSQVNKCSSFDNKLFLILSS